MSLPQKPRGKYYGVVLRAADFSFGKVARKGAFGGGAAFPVPDFGEGCVCCNGSTDGRLQPVSATEASDHFDAPPVDVPICVECADHAAERTGSAVIAACLLMVGAPLAVLGMTSYDSTAVVVGGAVIFALGVVWLMSLQRRRLEGTAGAHHPGLSLGAAPGQLVVRTTNRALAERVCALNEARLHRVR